MNNLLKETTYIMKKYKIKANKSLGQNFLIDEFVINNIIESAQIGKEDLVIEIGPGLGTLTKYLLEKDKKVICIELDKKMITILEDRFSLYNNLQIINNDVLKVDLNSMILEEKRKTQIKNVKIVANLPYYITTPIIMKLLESKLDIQSITVMIQKEVADRLIAKPGDKQTGAITYTVYYYCEGEKVLEVPHTSFIPEPEVTSEVIKLNIRKEPIIKNIDEITLFKIIKAAFMQRRKTLLNSLTNAHIFKDKEEGTIVLNNCGLLENTRAENLTLQDFAKITNEILKY